MSSLRSILRSLEIVAAASDALMCGAVSNGFNALFENAALFLSQIVRSRLVPWETLRVPLLQKENEEEGLELVGCEFLHSYHQLGEIQGRLGTSSLCRQFSIGAHVRKGAD